MTVDSLARRLKNGGVTRLDDPHPIDLVSKQPSCRLNLNLIVRLDVFQFAEKSVAVPSDAAVPGLPWKRSAFDVSRTQPQHSRTGPLQNGDGNSQPRYIYSAQNVACFDRRFGLWFVAFLFPVDLGLQGSFRRSLKESCVEQSEADVTERKNTSDEKQSLTPANKPSHSRAEASRVQL